MNFSLMPTWVCTGDPPSEDSFTLSKKIVAYTTTHQHFCLTLLCSVWVVPSLAARPSPCVVAATHRTAKPHGPAHTEKV